MIRVRHKFFEHVGFLVYRGIAEIEITSDPLWSGPLDNGDYSFNGPRDAAVIFDRDPDSEVHCQWEHLFEGGHAAVDTLLQIVLARFDTAQVHAYDWSAKVRRGFEFRDVGIDLLGPLRRIARCEVSFHDQARDPAVICLKSF